eukprot:scaffold29703_cov140-Isochrysis_galbana.AAC.1
MCHRVICVLRACSWQLASPVNGACWLGQLSAVVAHCALRIAHSFSHTLRSIAVSHPRFFASILSVDTA